MNARSYNFLQSVQNRFFTMIINSYLSIISQCSCNTILPRFRSGISFIFITPYGESMPFKCCNLSTTERNFCFFMHE